MIAQADAAIAVTKTASEQYVHRCPRARRAHGLACVALALFSGWLAGVIFRRD